MSGKIYFIRCNDRIKIGYSLNLATRLKSLQTASAHKLELIVSIDGPPALERAIHAHLAPHHSHGEWFFDCAPVRDCISELISIGGQAVGFRPVEPRLKTWPDPIPTADAVPDISDSTLARVQDALAENGRLLPELERRIAANEDFTEIVARAKILAEIIGPSLFPKSCGVAA